MNKYLRKGIAVMLILIMTAALSACSGNSANETSSSAETTLSQIDMSKWQYNEDDDVYYQIGISYCENPADESYETLAVFVPGAYMTSTVAKYWRIRTGINQSDCALSTEVNLALALESCDGVSDVDFETVWGQGHTQAERTGNSSDNFIDWINDCMGK